MEARLAIANGYTFADYKSQGQTIVIINLARQQSVACTLQYLEVVEERIRHG